MGSCALFSENQQQIYPSEVQNYENKTQEIFKKNAVDVDGGAHSCHNYVCRYNYHKCCK